MSNDRLIQNIFSLISKEKMYYALIFLLILNTTLADASFPNYTDSFVQDILVGLNLLISLCCIAFLDFKSRATYFTIFLICLGVLSYMFGKQTGLLFIILATVLGSKMDFRQLLKFIFCEKAILVFFIVMLSLFNILEGKEVLFSIFKETEKTITLGFDHANTFASTIGVLIIMYMNIKADNLSKLDMSLIVLILIFTFLLTKCRTMLIIFMIYFFLLYLQLRMNRRKKIFKMWNEKVKYALFFIVFFNFLFIILKMAAPENVLLLSIDKYIFNGRIGLASEYFSEYPITFFGGILDLSLISDKLWYYALDNGYTFILLYYGVMGFLVYIFLLQKSFKRIIAKHNPYLIASAICMMLWIVFEGIMVGVNSNFILLAMNKKIE